MDGNGEIKKQVYLRELKRIVAYLLLCVAALLGGCKEPDDGSVELTVASKQSYKLNDEQLPEKMFVVLGSTADGQWKVVDLRNTQLLDYQLGHEYTIRAFRETFEPDVFPQFEKKVWWQISEVIEVVQRDTELPDNIYIYTEGSPWGFDPRDPMLEYLLTLPGYGPGTGGGAAAANEF